MGAGTSGTNRAGTSLPSAGRVASAPGGLAAQGPSLFGEALGGVAVFFDVENLLLGVQGDFDVRAVTAHLAERGALMVARAYADWARYRRQQRQFLEEGVQMVFVPSHGPSDRSRTDAAICVDAMEILFTRPSIDTFVIVSGDSDFALLAQRLRDHGRRVVGVSARASASPVLAKQCHEFIYYETLLGQRTQGATIEEGERRVARAIDKVIEEHGRDFPVAALKARMRAQDAAFSERNYGATTFTRFLAAYDHLVAVRHDGTAHALTRLEASGRELVAMPRLTDRQLADARLVALRTAIEASGRGKGALGLSRLKDLVQSVQPGFDELALGFESFGQFVLAFPDLFTIDLAANTVRPQEGIAPLPPDLGAGGTAADAAQSSDRRRRKKPREDGTDVPEVPAKAGPKSDTKAEPKPDAKPEAPHRPEARAAELPLVPSDLPTLATTVTSAAAPPTRD